MMQISLSFIFFSLLFQKVVPCLWICFKWMSKGQRSITVYLQPKKWSPSEISRRLDVFPLWPRCVFELAAFLKSRRNKPCRLLIKPLILAPFTFAFLNGHTGPLLCETLLPGGGSFFFIRILYLVPFMIAILVLHHYWRGILEGDEQLGTFQWKDTTCTCCSRDHVDEHGRIIQCDKEALTRCIEQWFGSVDNFDHLVRTEVRAAFRSQMTRIPFGVLDLMGQATGVQT